MEQCLDRASVAVKQLSDALDQYVEAQEALQSLSDYYGSPQWKQDYADDEAGLFPQNLQRGVLSEDGIWNVLEENRKLMDRMRDIVGNELQE